jgi:GT2 family glycosyltransferase
LAQSAMVPTPSPLVVTVVVNFNGLRQTIACADSLLAGTYPMQAVIVVDNASTDPDAGGIRARFGERVEVLALPRNQGYGGGANAGIRLALSRGARYVWVLNNDVVVRSDTLEQLVAAMEAADRIGVASPQITAPVSAEAPAGIWFAGGTIDLRRGETAHLRDAIPPGQPVPFPFLTGCSLLLRSEAIREVGLFWDWLFLFWEDGDLVLRMQRAGWATVVVPSAWLFHEVHGSIPGPLIRYFHFRNAIVVAWRHSGPVTAIRAGMHLGRILMRSSGGAMLRRHPFPLREWHGLVAGAAISAAWSISPPEHASLEAPGLEGEAVTSGEGS